LFGPHGVDILANVPLPVEDLLHGVVELTAGLSILDEELVLAGSISQRRYLLSAQLTTKSDT